MVGGKYMKEQEKQIKEMAKEIGNTWLVDLEGDTKDVCEVLDEVDIKGIARELYEKGYRKLPKDSVVLSREEYEMLANQYKNLEIKYSNLCDNYRLCKDANETLKQNVITIRKKTVKEILQEIRGYYPIDKEHCNDGELFILNLCEDIASRYGVEVEK